MDFDDLVDALAVVGAVALAIALGVLALVIVPLCGMLVHWIIADIMHCQIESMWFWTGVALIDVYAFASIFAGLSKGGREDD